MKASRPLTAGEFEKEDRRTMSTDTLAPEAPFIGSDTPDAVIPPIGTSAPETASTPEVAESPKKAAVKKAAGRKAKTIELTLTVIGTADGEWRAELKQGSTYLARDLAVAAAAVSRAAKELHTDLSVPIDEVIEEARAQQAAKVAALEAELAAARKALADLD
jgi:hypothetical protein